MSFRENLLKKIEINRLAEQIRETIAPAASQTRLDRALMRELLALSSFEPLKERDLELYVKQRDDAVPLVLVLDNELPVYRTSVEDVVMRKSPYIKEMASIRNIVKILKDSDVKISRKEATLDAVQKDCLASLDLSYGEADIEAIAYDGAASLESNYPEGVIENLTLLADLAGFEPAPAPFKSAHHFVCGRLQRNEKGAVSLGPLFFYDRVHGRLGLVEGPLSASNPRQMETYKRHLDGAEKPAVRGADVFKHMQRLILQ